MGEEAMGRAVARAVLAAPVMGLLILISGCHANGPDKGVGLADAGVPAGRVDTAQVSAKKVASAGVEIVSACAKEPYANANKGLIVAETGLDEDVFDLRDTESYKAIPFGLNEAQRLEALLRKEGGEPARLDYPAKQAECIAQFVDHLQTLTDPLVEADSVQRQLDASAFNKASKEADQVSQQEMEQEEKAMEPKTSGQQ